MIYQRLYVVNLKKIFIRFFKVVDYFLFYIRGA